MGFFAKIDFENTIEIDEVSPDLKLSFFSSKLKNGESALLKVEISNESHDLLPNVFNLAFGPINSKGQIDDKAELSHADISKVFSTIVLTALNYLTANPGHYIGIDGSDNNRAELYWRFCQRNYDYLRQYFDIFGLKYYVRISRFGKTQYDNPFDFDDIHVAADRIPKTDTRPALMYNYFIFKLR